MKIKSLLVAGLLGTAMAAQASVISVNFEGGLNGAAPNGHDVTGTAGYVPVGNWNNASGPANSGSLLNLSNSNGGNSGASVSWSTLNLWDLANGDDLGGDNDMMSGYLDNFNGNVTVSNVPYDSYDVYVYFNRASPTYSGITAGDGVTTETLYGKDNGNSFASNGFLLSTDDTVDGTDGSWTVGNVMLFSEFTGSTLTITPPSNPGAPGEWKAYIGGIQIVNTTVPEPSTLALLGAGGMVLWGARRRQRRM